MFKINDRTIHCSRGDIGGILLKIPVSGSTSYHTFDVGDEITFNVYNKQGYDAEPVLHKVITVAEQAQSVLISLTEEDTTFGEISNKPVTYWYDVTLNDGQTVICYNDDGPQEFIQYPAKGADE